MGGISGTLSEYEGQAPLLLALPHVGKCRRTSLAATVGTEAEYAGCGDVYQRAANGSR